MIEKYEEIFVTNRLEYAINTMTEEDYLYYKSLIKLREDMRKTRKTSEINPKSVNDIETLIRDFYTTSPKMISYFRKFKKELA